MRHCRVRQLWGLLLIFPSTVRVAAAGPAEDYIDAQLNVVQGLENDVDSIVCTADVGCPWTALPAAIIYLAGEPGMVAELLGRAGGLCGAEGHRAGQAVAKTPSRRMLFCIATTAWPIKSADRRWSELCSERHCGRAVCLCEEPDLSGNRCRNGLADPRRYPVR